MPFVKRIAGVTTLAVATLIGYGVSLPAQAGYLVTVEQVGSNVVATGFGDILLTELSLVATSVETNSANIDPADGVIDTGPAGGPGEPQGPVKIYRGLGGIFGPSTFGRGPATFANSGSGDVVVMDGGDQELILPEGYVSGRPLSDTATYDDTTIASLGVVPGMYVWGWGDAAINTFTLVIGRDLGVVPEPSSLVLLGSGFGLLGLITAGRFRRGARRGEPAMRLLTHIP